MARASKQPAPKAHRRPSANAFPELVAERLEELSGGLSQLETPRKGAIAGACSPTPCGSFCNLKRFIAMITPALDESRPGSLQRQTVLRTFAVLEPAARDPSHEMEWSCPVLETEGPIFAPRSRAEQGAVVAFH